MFTLSEPYVSPTGNLCFTYWEYTASELNP